MNKRDAINQIRQFGNRFDRFRKSQGGGDGNRNTPKRAKAAPKPNSRKTNVFNEQVRYAFHGALQDLKSKPLATFLTVMVIAISLTLPSVCYMVYKNVNQAASQYYPSPQITVYLDKALDDNAAAQVVGQIQPNRALRRSTISRVMKRWVSSATGQGLVARWTCSKKTRCLPWQW